MRLWVILPLIVLMLLLRWRRVGILSWAFAWWGAMYALFRFGFTVPVPASVITIYMAIVSGSIFAYISSSRERWEAFAGPLLNLILKPRYRLLLAAIVVLIPALMAFNVYSSMNTPLEAPAYGRSIHPAPPGAITVHDNKIDLASAENPYRALEQNDPEAFAEHLENGRRVYFQNCFFCHGDAMAGDGMFAHGLNPIPSNFTDSGVLPILQESFVFWRVSKGGPGMPAEGGPWDSAMPVWEKFLTEEELWDAVLFLYDYTNYRPRAREEHH